MNDAARQLLLALADDELCMGQGHARWIGIGPFLEEDLAFTSIAQDELAHARALFHLIVAAADTGGADLDSADLDSAGFDGAELDRRADALAMGRPFEQYRSCALVEDPCDEWADALVRHVLYDEAETLRWRALDASSEPGVAELAARVLVEEEYHLRHARSLFVRLLRGTPASRQRIEAALARLAPLATGLFTATAGEADALAAGVVAAPAAQLRVAWERRMAELCAGGGLAWPPGGAPLPDRPGDRTVRSAGFASLHAEMTAVYALDPQAAW